MGSEKPNADQLNGVAAVKGREDGEKHKKAQQPPPKKGGPGGYDATPVCHAPPGYTVKITFHRATKLPMADLSTFSSDPYLLAQLDTDLVPRHKEDTPLKFRSRTLWQTTDPEWNEEWIIGHVPASGFRLKVRIYDEDSSDQDDKLGNVYVEVGKVDEQWEGIKNVAYKVKKRSGSWRAYFLRGAAVCMSAAKDLNARLHISVEVLGRTEGTEGGRAYTIGPNYWCKNYSPLLGRLVGQKASEDFDETDAEVKPVKKTPTGLNQNGAQLAKQVTMRGKLTTKDHNSAGKRKAHHYNFESNQIQLRGPVPAELYHRYVEFRPYVKSLYTGKGLRGIILNRGLHIQHYRVYNYNKETRYGKFDAPSVEMTQRFLDLVHHDELARVFTYVILLDGLMRFTETGKEFRIDHLSKHTMHSDVSIYIAYAGEFFIRRRKRQRPHREESAEQMLDSPLALDSVDDPAQSIPPAAERYYRSHNQTASSSYSNPSRHLLPRDPSHYELIIDNSSGTYRPNGKLLPVLRSFLAANLLGLRVVTLNAIEDAELIRRLKDEQRARQLRESGPEKIYPHPESSSASTSSVSSGDEQRLHAVIAAQEQDRRQSQTDGARQSPDSLTARGPSQHEHKPGEAAPFLGEHHAEHPPGPGVELAETETAGREQSPAAGVEVGKRTGYKRERWNYVSSQPPSP